MKKIKLSSFIFWLIFIVASCSTRKIAQQSCKIQLGTLKSLNVSVSAFAAQNEIIIAGNYSIDTATAYFFIPGNQAVLLVQMRPSFDSAKFNHAKKLLFPGASVTFKAISHENGKNDICEATCAYVIISGN